MISPTEAIAVPIRSSWSNAESSSSITSNLRC